MRLRARGFAFAAALGLLVAGCGGAQPATTVPPDRLTVYSALPLHGPGSERSRDVVDGERLALEAAGGRAGGFAVRLRSIDDAAPPGGSQPAATLDAARAAVKDPQAIAYLADFDAAGTALSLPTTNAQQVLQVSPGTTYDGFTGGDGSSAGEPEKYEPSGRRTFGRIAPPDAVQARVIAGLMAEQACRRVAVLRAPSAFDASLAALVADALARRRIRVVVAEQVRPDPGAHLRAAQDVRQAGADCATFAGTVADAPRALLRTLYGADPTLRIVAPMALADQQLARGLGAAAAVTTIVGPARPGARFAAAFARRFGRPPGPWAAYGHDAMRGVLRAIARAGARGNDRRAVIAAYLAMPAPGERLGLWRPTARGLRFAGDLPAD